MRIATIVALGGLFCVGAAPAAGADADAVKKCREAFAPLKLPAAAKIEKDLEPMLPQGIVTEAGPFDALVRRLLEPYEQRFKERTEALGRVAAAPTPEAADAVAAGLRTVGAENEDLAARLARAEESYAEVWDAGYMESGEKERRARKAAAVLVPFHRALMFRNAAIGQDAASALVAMSDGPALEWLLKSTNDAWPIVRVAVAAALERVARAEAREALARMAVADAVPMVRSRALASLGAWKIAEMKDVAMAALADDAWEVRALAIAMCVRANLVEAAGPLIDALAKEPGRLRDDIDRALHALVGTRFYGDVDLWRRWWSDHREEVAAKAAQLAAAGEYDHPVGAPETWPEAEDAASGGGDAEKQKGVTSSFYGIVTASKRVLFVVDISMSMEERAGAVPAVTGGPKSAWPAPQGKARIDVAKWQLHRAIEALPADAVFNLVLYSESYKTWAEQMTAATPKGKAKAHDFVDALKENGTTNISDSLDEAFDLAGAPPLGQSKKTASAELAVDTVFLLSDGVPNRGRVSDPTALVEAVVARNHLTRIVIHAVGIGDSADGSLLQALARRTGGTYVAFK